MGDPVFGSNMFVCSCSIASKKSTKALLPSADGLAAADVDAEDDCFGSFDLEPFAAGEFFPEEADLDSVAGNVRGVS